MSETRQSSQFGQAVQLSHPARVAIFAAASAAILLAHLGLQLLALVLYGKAPGSAYLVWHVIAVAGLSIAWLAMRTRWYLLSYCLMVFLFVDVAFGLGSALLARYGLFENYLPPRVDVVS